MHKYRENVTKIDLCVCSLSTKKLYIIGMSPCYVVSTLYFVLHADLYNSTIYWSKKPDRKITLCVKKVKFLLAVFSDLAECIFTLSWKFDNNNKGQYK